jgi:hypothetical protein
MPRILLRAPKSPFDVRSPAETLRRNLIASNSGNLVFIEAAWKLLSVPGAEIEADRLVVRPSGADEINERFDAYVIPLANAFRNSYRDQLDQTTALLRRLRIPVVVLGVGAQGSTDYSWDAIRPIERSVKEFVAAVLDRSPSIGVRGEGTLEYLNGLGFRDVDVIGCPSMFLWGDRLPVARKVEGLDARSKLAITISPYRTAMGQIAMNVLARYPDLLYIAQDLDTLALLLYGTSLPDATPGAALPLHPAHPFFAQRQARFYVDPWPWIRDLREVDYCFGSRIHGTIAALLAGTPATVLAHDSRTLELARYFGIPHRLLRDVPATIDPAELYADADLAALVDGHAARFDVFTGFLARHGLDQVFAHEGAAAAFDARVAATPYPDAVGAGPVPGPGDLRFAAGRARYRVRRVLTGPGVRRLRGRLGRRP